MDTLLHYIFVNRVVLARYSSIFISFVTTLFIIKVFGIDKFGYYAFFLSLVKILSVIGSFGSSLTVTRRFGHNPPDFDEGAYLKSYFYIIIVSTVLVSTVGGGLLGSVVLSLDNHSCALLSGTIVTASFLEFILSFSRAKQRFVQFYLMGSPAQNFFFVVGCILFVGSGPEFDGKILILMTISFLVVFLVNLVLIAKDLALKPSKGTSVQWAPIVRYDMAAVITATINAVTSNLEIFLYNILFGIKVAGIARITFQMFYLITIPFGIINVQYHNLVRRACNRKRYEMVYRALKKRYIYYFGIGIIPTVAYAISLFSNIETHILVFQVTILTLIFFVEVAIGPSNLFSHLLNRSQFLLAGSVLSITTRCLLAATALYSSIDPVIAVILSISVSNIIGKLVTFLSLPKFDEHLPAKSS